MRDLLVTASLTWGAIGIMCTPVSAAAQASLPPVVARAPRAIARVLVVDSTTAVAPAPSDPPQVGAHGNGCTYALRDPKSGVRYLLFQSSQVSMYEHPRPGHTVTRTSAKADYLLADGPLPVLPAGYALRVACGENHVLGLVRVRKAGA